MSMDVVVDNRAAVEYLAKLNAAGTEKIIRKGLTAGAVIFRRAMQAEAPVKARAKAGATGMTRIHSKPRAYGQPGDLRRSVRSSRIRNGATIGVAIGPMGKLAFTRHWVNHGTRAHVIPIRIRGRIERIPHPGARANPFVDRASSAVEAAAIAAAEQVILREAANL